MSDIAPSERARKCFAFIRAAIDMTNDGREPDAIEAHLAMTVCERLAYAFRDGGMTEEDRLMVRAMYEVVHRSREPQSQEKRGCYRRSAAAVETAAMAVQSTDDNEQQRRLAIHLVFNLAGILDPRMTNAIPDPQGIVEALKAYDPDASGRKGHMGSVRILAAMIVKAGGLDSSKFNEKSQKNKRQSLADRWTDTIIESLRRESLSRSG